ncbi:MAG: glycoside hydrolase family 32 protein [Saprospiraceae bacterium]
MKKILPNIAVVVTLCLLSMQMLQSQSDTGQVKEPYRPAFHFSPKAHWMNDPNGMVFHNGIYHLFFQYYPDGLVWGPMHWGHATSKDLIHWEEQPIALYPDSLGYIFSGSTVFDEFNLSGLGKKHKAPLVAIFTHHNPAGEAAGLNTYQNQSLTFSSDEGKSWTKYSHNPVLKNPGIKDFRDPKVSWYAIGKKWIMTLATSDRITFYSSRDLKNWKKESEFGENLGAHGGVWECPDLFPLEIDRKEVWVLLVSINPGGPNGGSATQYFIGHFDGQSFTASDTTTRFMDYGPDDYAGVTISNTAKRKILIGWMSNWQYGKLVPTTPWRSAMTVPRELGLKELGGKLFLISNPVAELSARMREPIAITSINVKNKFDLSNKINDNSSLFSLTIADAEAKDFSIVLTNDAGDEMVIGYDKKTNQYYIDRTKSGIVDFEPGFAKILFAPRIAFGPINLTLLADKASVELFADGGLSVMTGIFFPRQPIDKIYLKSDDGERIKSVIYQRME